MGPLANDRRLAAMDEIRDNAIAKGAELLTGGERIGKAGNFWKRMVLDNVPLEARLFNDEPFAPVAGIRGFERLDEAIAEANRLSFGLAGYAFTRSLTTADLQSRRMEVGMLWINTPPQASRNCHSGASRIPATAPSADRKRSKPI